MLFLWRWKNKKLYYAHIEEQERDSKSYCDEKILIKIKMIVPNSSLIMWLFQMEGSGNEPCRKEKILCSTNNGEQERYCRSYEDGNVLRNDSNECAE